MNDQELRKLRENVSRLHLENKDLVTRMNSQKEQSKREGGREGGIQVSLVHSLSSVCS